MRALANTLDARSQDTPLTRCAAGCAIAFVVILGITAYWDPTIRVLHVFESLPYIVAAVLCLRQHKWIHAGRGERRLLVVDGLHVDHLCPQRL